MCAHKRKRTDSREENTRQRKKNNNKENSSLNLPHHHHNPRIHHTALPNVTPARASNPRGSIVAVRVNATVLTEDEGRKGRTKNIPS